MPSTVGHCAAAPSKITHRARWNASRLIAIFATACLN